MDYGTYAVPEAGAPIGVSKGFRTYAVPEAGAPMGFWNEGWRYGRV